MNIFEYDRDKHMKLIYQEAYEEGFAEGFKSVRDGQEYKYETNIAKKMLEKGTYPDEEIMSLTGITKEELEKLKKL